MVDGSLFGATSDEPGVVKSQHRQQKSNSISQFIYARLDVLTQHSRYQRYEFVSSSSF